MNKSELIKKLEKVDLEVVEEKEYLEIEKAPTMSSSRSEHRSNELADKRIRCNIAPNERSIY